MHGFLLKNFTATYDIFALRLSIYFHETIIPELITKAKVTLKKTENNQMNNRQQTCLRLIKKKVKPQKREYITCLFARD